MSHKLCKIPARSGQRFGGRFRKTHGGLHPLHWRGLKSGDALLRGKVMTMDVCDIFGTCTLRTELLAAGAAKKIEQVQHTKLVTDRER